MNNERSDEQILEAAMCAWECIDGKTNRQNGVHTDAADIWKRMTQLRVDIGSPSMRYYTGLIAACVSEAYYIAETTADGYYDDPFDWEFVPLFLQLSLEVEGGAFSLRDDWRDVAKTMGESHKAARKMRALEQRQTCFS